MSRKYLKPFILVSATLMLGVLIPSITSCSYTSNLNSLNRQSADEGIVVVKNQDNVLPLKNKTISVFGVTQINTFYGGGGSAAVYHPTYSINVLNGFKQNKHLHVNLELADYYSNAIKNHISHYSNVIDNGIENATNQEMNVSDNVIEEASTKSDVAVVVLGRYTREGRDLSSWYTGPSGLGDWNHFKLTTDSNKVGEIGEVELLTKICSKFNSVVVVLNTTTVIDMSPFQTTDLQNVKGIVYGWAGGNETGSSIADILSGDVCPSGRLTDTITKNGIGDYPSDWQFDNGNWGSAENYYAEDIYVGYRYFETFAPDKVLYHFGYGLSYTNFSLQCLSFQKHNDKVLLDVSVINNGMVSGKQVVQLYFSAPNGVLGKPSHELMAYGKTKTLNPHESQILKFELDIKQMASYNDIPNNALSPNAWVLEQGDYHIYYGTSSNINDLTKAGDITINQNTTVEQAKQSLTPRTSFERHYNDGTNSWSTFQDTPPPKSNAQLKTEVQEHIQSLGSAIPITGDKGLKLNQVYSDSEKLKAFIGQLDKNQLANIVATNWDQQGIPSIPGTSSVVGGLNSTLRNMHVPTIRFVEGTAGIKDGLKKSTQIPINIQLGCTFNNVLVHQLCSSLAAEMKSLQAPVILAPGVNIHRDPRCGRNFEYFSEDPLLSGMMASEKIKGWQSGSIACVIKHFAANNQEWERYSVNEHISERALREIHLKSFEIAIQQSQPFALMTSYNQINDRHSTENFELKTELLQDEWNYHGLIMTDWGSKGTNTEYPEYQNTNSTYTTNLSTLIRAGGDIAQDAIHDNTNSALLGLQLALENNIITLQETQKCISNVLEFVSKTYVFREMYHLPKYNYDMTINNVAPIFIQN